MRSVMVSEAEMEHDGQRQLQASRILNMDSRGRWRGDAWQGDLGKQLRRIHGYAGLNVPFFNAHAQACFPESCPLASSLTPGALGLQFWQAFR
jgi:hypothetical protein